MVRHIKKQAILCFLILTATCSTAQMTINATPPSQNFQIEDLWSLTISGSNSTYSHFKVNMQISEFGKGLLFDMTSASFQYNGNTLNINRSNLSDFKPFVSNYVRTSELSGMGQNGGSFPVGDYNIQYTLLGLSQSNPSAGYINITQTGYSHTVYLVQPTNLIYLIDKDTITDKHPAFAWTPSILPSTYNDGVSNSLVTYTFNLTKIIGNQSPFQAISSNTMQYTQADLTQSYLQYPYSATELEDSATYAWQVHAYVNSSLLSSSEVWIFTIMKKEKVIIVPTPLLRKEKTQNFIKIENNTLGFSYFEEYGQGMNTLPLTIRFFNEHSQSYVQGSETIIQVAPGINRYQLSLCPSEVNLSDGLYLLELRNQKGEIYYLRFIFEQETGCN